MVLVKGPCVGAAAAFESTPVDALCAVTWAKSWPRDGPAEEWLDLPQHLDDSGDVAALLWDEWLADNLRDLIARAFPDGRRDARRLVRFLAGVHDVGKATPAFVSAVPVLSDRIVASGLVVSSTARLDRSMLRHEVAGAAIVDRWLSVNTRASRSLRRALGAVVAGHHGGFHPYTSVQGAPDRPHLFGEGRWLDVQDALVRRAAVRADVQDRWEAWSDVRLDPPTVMVVAGLVVMADWIASDDRWFPLRPLEDAATPRAPAQPDSRRARTAWRRLDLSRRWVPRGIEASVDHLFSSRFPQVGDVPNPLQRDVVDVARAMPATGLLVLEAPMGSGKTEAALMAAEILAGRSGASGIFVALPTQATSDAMFSRVRRYLQNVPAGDDVRLSLSLAHSKAALNEEHTALPVVRARDVHDEPDVSPRRAVPVADLWMRGRKRAGLATFVVGTIDQVLFGSLLARHVMLRQLATATKVVVIDEVHAADAYMATYLDRAIEWLGATGTPVVLLSATLPAVRRRELFEAYDRGRRLRLDLTAVPAVEASALTQATDYPLITATGADGPTITAVGAVTPTSTVRVRRLDDDIGSLVDLLEEALRNGGAAAVIRNTVTRAQETARHLEAVFGPDVVTVAHARFIAADRRENDLRLLAELGPDGDRPERRIVVGTQVLEQSLDVDFDVMVTDLAPVDLVLQRIGRLHRHRRHRRPRPVSEPVCYIAGADWGAAVPEPDRGSIAVYGRYSLLASAAALGPHLDGAPVEMPRDIARLVRTAYEPEATAPPGWEDVWASAARADEAAQRGRRRRAAAFLLPPPDVRDLYGVARGGVGEVDEDSPSGQACVRDSGDSIEVVVVQRGPDGVDRVPDWVADGRTLPFRHVPIDDYDARLLARCTVRLPPVMSRDPRDFDRVVAELERSRFEGWDSSPLLRGQLALVLDEACRASVAGFDLHYERGYGLTATRVEGMQ